MARVCTRLDGPPGTPAAGRGRANLAPIVRILLDYRPALVTRTGVGEYVHRLAEALIRVSAGRDTVTLFASSWKNRLRPEVIPGARVADARVPARLLTSLWHRADWPPVERLASGLPRLPLCAAARHSSRMLLASALLRVRRLPAK